MNRNQSTSPDTEQRKGEDEFTRFFSFRGMITPYLIKIIYPIGIIVILIEAIVIPKQMFLLSAQMKVIMFLLIFAGGNIGWRIVCEGMILLYSIHEILASMERNLKQK